MKQAPIRLSVLLLAWLVALLPSLAGQEQPKSLVQAAVDSYASALELQDRSEQLAAFRHSQQLFQQAIEANTAADRESSPELWLAFANASLQSEKVGWAILGYRSALASEPSNTQAVQNLRFARSLVTGWQSPQSDGEFGDTLFFWRTSYSQSAQNLFAAGLFFAAGICAAVAIASRRSWILWIGGALIAAWIVFCIPIFIDALEERRQLAVIVSDEAILRTADTPGAPERLTAPIPGGAELTVLSRRGDWVEVEIPQGSGWLRAHEIRSLDAPLSQAPSSDND
ncbi:MAG: hypothetical protein Aurels2KO_43930 [Aureliella sp.]